MVNASTDLEDVYQKAVQMKGQSGGWPLTVFATPQGEPCIASREWQSFYHSTLGARVEDGRLSTLPAYNVEEER